MESDKKFVESYEEAKRELEEFKKQAQEGDEDKVKKTTRLSKSLSHFEVENAAFDKSFHSTMEVSGNQEIVR